MFAGGAPQAGMNLYVGVFPRSVWKSPPACLGDAWNRGMRLDRRLVWAIASMLSGLFITRLYVLAHTSMLTELDHLVC
jgi:hypothetical protein